MKLVKEWSTEIKLVKEWTMEMEHRNGADQAMDLERTIAMKLIKLVKK